MKPIHRVSLLGIALSLLLGLSLLHSTNNFNDADTNHCQGIYMHPSYLRLTGLDSSHSRLSTKYQTYLYREQRDGNPQPELDKLNGTPVLFIPGNAGSYKQGRSIAAETAYNEVNGTSFDFFMAHFNGDFTAFHGRTLLDQSEYLNDAIRFILSLYSKKHNAVLPQSVIIIAHSMGGIVARVIPTLPNYVEGSLNTIISLAAPHATAPGTFDGDILSLYSSTNEFWRSAYFGDSDSIAHQRLRNVSLISITGGGLDQMLPADYTTLQGLVPLTNGFTIYTTTIPQVWTPIDHLAIVWCDQLRKKVSQSLYAISDINSASKTKPLDQRISEFKKIYLSGFEEYALEGQHEKQTLKLKRADIIEKNESGRYHRVSINESFSLLSDYETPVFACNLQQKDSKYTESYDCLELPLNKIPNSDSHQNSLLISSSNGQKQPFYGIALSPQFLQNYTYMIFEKSPKENHFTAFSPKTSRLVTSSLLRLLFGVDIKITKDVLVTDLSVKNAWSSILVYELSTSLTPASQRKQFSPFIRQYIEDPFESKWHLQLHKPKQISFHGIAPYTPFIERHNLHLEVWKPLDEEITISLKINVFKSLKSLVLRYRLAIACFPIFIITFTLLIQFYTFFETSNFPNFEESLNYLCSKTPPILIGLSLLSVLSSNPFFKYLFYLTDPAAQSNPLKLPNVQLNPYFLGLEEKFLCVLFPFFYIITITLVYLVYHILNTFLLLIFMAKKVLNLQNRSRRKIHTPENIKSQKRILGATLVALFVNFFVPYQFAVIICTLTQTLVTIKSYFKFEEHNCKSSITAEKVSNSSKLNFLNYNLSLLVLMLWLIPVNVPILIVFFHNMAIRWKTPFTSHHNILAIMPIVLLISSHVRFEEKFLEYLTLNGLKGKSCGSNAGISRLRKFLTLFLLGWFGWFSLIYGVRSLYYLHYFFNLFCAWLVMTTYWNLL